METFSVNFLDEIGCATTEVRSMPLSKKRTYHGSFTYYNVICPGISAVSDVIHCEKNAGNTNDNAGMAQNGGS